MKRTLCILTAFGLLALGPQTACSAGDCPDLSGEWTVVSHCDGDPVGATVGISHLSDEGVETCGFVIDVDGPNIDGYAWHDGTVSIYGRFEDSNTQGCSGQATPTSMNLMCGVTTADCAVQLSKGGSPVTPPNPPPANCLNLDGNWTYEQVCKPSDSYFDPGEQETFHQTGCTFTFVDTSGFSWSGSISSSNDITMSASFLGDTLSCTGSATSTSIDVDCDPNLCGGYPSKFVFSR